MKRMLIPGREWGPPRFLLPGSLVEVFNFVVLLNKNREVCKNDS